ncbi:MAG: hypothetical protein ACRDWA_13960 [Acidimicrobiia bacterium]
MGLEFKAPFVLALMLLMLAGCGGGVGDTTMGDKPVVTTTTLGGSADDTTTTVAAARDTTTTTTAPATTTTEREDVIGIEDIPPECRAVIVEVLRLLEPAVADVDWANATIEDHIALANELDGASIEGVEGCDEVNLDVHEEFGSDLLIEFAQSEAPGTVGYLEAIRSLRASFDGTEANGDCLTALATLEAIVEEGVPMAERIPA